MLIDFNMPATLRSAAGDGFSKTARSGPRHGEARRHRSGLGSIAILARRSADDLAKCSAEGAKTAETNVQTDIGHAAVCFAQEKHRAFDSSPLQIAMRRFAKGRPKGTDKV